jgi:hypothetical protein
VVLYVLRMTLKPELADEYNEWHNKQQDAILANASEMRGYRVAAGDKDVVLTFHFADMAAWASWQEQEGVQEFISGLRRYTNARTRELWAPSPGLAEPVAGNN